MRIAILGAPCTGKTQLAHALAQSLQSAFAQIACVPDPLHAWCATHNQSPTTPELTALAQRHMASILAHAPTDLLLCDTTPLQMAVYSDVVLGDDTLYPWALGQQQAFDITLLCGLDLPALQDRQASGDAALRQRMDARLRAVLLTHQRAFSTVYGTGPARGEHARLVILNALRAAPDTARSNWQWSCEKCSDAECEHRLFSSLVAKARAR